MKKKTWKKQKETIELIPTPLGLVFTFDVNATEWERERKNNEIAKSRRISTYKPNTLTMYMIQPYPPLNIL